MNTAASTVSCWAGSGQAAPAARDLWRLTATEAVVAIRAGTLSVRDLVMACLEQIDRLEPQIEAWAHLDPRVALHEADVLDARLARGEQLGALGGVPVGVKDIFNTVDMPTQMGSPIWAGFTPGNDARVVHYLRRADAIIPGKTVTAEFAVHAPGRTHNPHQRNHMPGTSSSGSAAAVAASMVPVALGTQTAGSIIRPASYCGIFGFKPSFGLLPRTGMLKTTDSLDTVGFFSRSVDDLALLFEILRVRGRDHPISHAALNDPRRQRKGDQPWRVALVTGPKWDCAEPYAREALFRLASDLNSLPDFDVMELNLPAEFARAHEIHSLIYDRALAYYFQDEFQKGTLVSPIMYDIIERGNKVTLDQYRQALRDQTVLAAKFDQLLQEHHIVLNLATGGEALEGLQSNDRPDSCLIWSLCGAPAINLPVFRGPKGLPFGAQVVARKYNDYLLLSFVRSLREHGLVNDGTYPSLPG